MTTYIVTEKATGNEVYRYQADAPQEDIIGFGFDTHDHIPLSEETAVVEQPIIERNISGVSYLRRFTQAERIMIRGAAAQSPILDDYLKLFDATIAQGGMVNLNDPDTICAVQMLEQAGLLGAGRAQEILNGN